jgi:hypothetical protein
VKINVKKYVTNPEKYPYSILPALQTSSLNRRTTMKTVTPVKVMADLMSIGTKPVYIHPHGLMLRVRDDGPSKLVKFDGLLPLTVTIEDGMLTLGTHHGPDMWRAKLKDLMKE